MTDDTPPGNALYAALARFQADLPRIETKSDAEVQGGRIHHYATLDVVTNATLPLLGKHGLAFIARPTRTEDGRFVLAYSLLHESGEHIDGEYPLPDKATPHQYGSALTYARRYSLGAVTGVAPGGEDNDAAAAMETTMHEPHRRPGGSAGQDAAAALKAAERRQRQRSDSVRSGRREDEEQPPEDQPGTIDDLQMRGIQARFRGILTREDLEQRYELAYAERFTQRPLDGPAKDHRSLANLSYAEAALLKDDLRGKTRDELVDGLLDDAGAS